MIVVWYFYGVNIIRLTDDMHIFSFKLNYKFHGKECYRYKVQRGLHKQPMYGQLLSITTEKFCNLLYSACKTIILDVNGD